MTMQISLRAAALLALAGCGSTTHRSSSQILPVEAQGLADARNALIAAATAGDPEALAGVYTSDAVLMNPNRPDVRGRENIEAMFRGAFANIAMRAMTLTPVEVRVNDGQAWELSTFTQVVERAGQPPAEDKGRVMLVWAREPDGHWRIRYALVNSSLAVSPLH